MQGTTETADQDQLALADIDGESSGGVTTILLAVIATALLLGLGFAVGRAANH